MNTRGRLALTVPGISKGRKHTLVLGVRLHEVHAGSNVLGVGSLGDELEVQGVAAGGRAIGARVVGTVNTALSSASGVCAAVGRVPLVAIVAVGRTAKLVEPSPVGVNRHGASDGAAAATGRALGPRQSRVGLSGEGACLLGRGSGHKGGEGSELGIHDE